MLLDALTGAGNRITSAIRSASQSTGITFDYLLKTAARESSFNPSAKATTSSARGLYQFIESTWLATVKEEGPRYGLGQYADAIERTPGGKYVVRDPAQRAQILKLRENPEVAALMAGAFTSRNSAELSRAIGREPTSGELYIAHFLGAAGAKRLLALKARAPGAAAADAFPEAARANRSVFYARDGSPRSANQVYAALTARHDRVPGQPAPATPPMAVAALPTTIATPQAGPAASPAAAALQAAIADPAYPIGSGRIAGNPIASSFAAGDAPVFHTLFREDNSAISPAVRALWGGVDPTSRQLASTTAATGAARAPLDLSGFLKPGIVHSGRRSGLGS